MHKKWLVVIVSLLLIPFVLADLSSTMSSVWNQILSIGNLSSLGLSAGSAVVAITRILIWILMFTIFFALIVSFAQARDNRAGALSFLNRNQALVVAAVIATISEIFIPPEVLLATGAGWATLIALILLGLPIFGLWWAAWNYPEGEETRGTILLKLILSFVLFWILSAMKYYVGRMA